MTAKYSNLFRFFAGADEVIFDFGSFFPTEPGNVPGDADFHTRIVLGMKVLDQLIPAMEQVKKNAELLKSKAAVEGAKDAKQLQ